MILAYFLQLKMPKNLKWLDKLVSTVFLLNRTGDSLVLFPCFQRNRQRANLKILYDRGVNFPFILDGRFVLGCPWLNLTDCGQYQTSLIFLFLTILL